MEPESPTSGRPDCAEERVDSRREAVRPILFGEVLFDRFPDGSSILGGAPFNVTWHLGGFGKHPLLVTRVGRDEEGREVLHRMTSWGLDTGGVQTDADRPTGRVRVELEGKHVRFEIEADQAWDHIDGKEALTGVEGRAFFLLYHGTLACRSAESRRALLRLRRKRRLPIFFDVNLRPPWWNSELLEELLSGCRWVKMNEEELGEVTEKCFSGREDLEEKAHRLLLRYSWDWLVVTRGSEGAGILTRDEVWWEPNPSRFEVVDTVGAGDAFSAVVVLGLQLGWDPLRTLRRAVRFAAETCRIRGAVSEDRRLYLATPE